MTNLLNKFVCIGQLSECQIDFYPTHAKCKMAIRIADNLITIYHSISRKYNQELYDKLQSMIPQLHPQSTGYVYIDNKKDYELTVGDTWIFCTGNLMEKNKHLFLNAMYISITQSQDAHIEIDMRGIWTKYGFMNILSDSPRIFGLDYQHKPSSEIYQLNLEIMPKEKCDKDVVKTLEKCANLHVKTIEKCDNKLEEKDIENWLLEWEIINED